MLECVCSGSDRSVRSSTLTRMWGLMHRLGRVVSCLGLAGLAVLHTVWAAGSPWPAKNRAKLADAVIGNAQAMPAAVPTAVIAVCSAGAAVAASGVIGSPAVFRVGLRALAVVMLLRAVLGGGAALAALGLPPARGRFIELDRQWYRPFAALMAVALWLAARVPIRETATRGD